MGGENCESSNVTGTNTKPDQLSQDNLTRTGPAVGAMCFPQCQLSVLKWFKTIQCLESYYCKALCYNTQNTTRIIYFLQKNSNPKVKIFYYSLTLVKLILKTSVILKLQGHSIKEL